MGSRQWDGCAHSECCQKRDLPVPEEIYIQSGHKILRYRAMNYFKNHQMLNSTSGNKNKTCGCF